VPLTDAAMVVVEAMGRVRHNGFVFPGAQGGPIHSMGLPDLLQKRLGYAVTVHGFRSAFADWAAETTAYPHEIVEQCLAHTVGSRTRRAYRRGDGFELRAEVMREWALFCAEAPAEVVPLRA
jgi:integrase